MHDGSASAQTTTSNLRDPRDERDGRILLALAILVALVAALRDFTDPWDGGFKGAMTSLYEDVFVRNHLTYGLSATHWSPAFVVYPEGGGVWHWHHPPLYPLWLTLFAATLGHSEWVLRLAHLLLFLPGIPALYWLVRNVRDARTAGWSSLLFAATPLVGYFGPMVCYDGALMSACIVTAAAFWRHCNEPSRRTWTIAALCFFWTASLDFLGQFCGLGLFAMALLSERPRAMAIDVLKMLPLSILAVAIIALVYGQFLGGPIGFLGEMAQFSSYEQSRASEVTEAAFSFAAHNVLVTFAAWPMIALAGAGLGALVLQGRVAKKPMLAVAAALLVPPLCGSAVTFKHFVDHPFWPMPWMAGLAALAGVLPAIGHRMLRERDFAPQLLGAMLAVVGALAVGQGVAVTHERMTFFAKNDPDFPLLVAEAKDKLDGAFAGFTNRTVISRRYEPGVIFQGDIDEAWEVDYVIGYGKQSGFRGDAVFLLDGATAKPELLAKLDSLATAQRLGRAVLYRFRAWQ